jgi:hypothetical protein
MGLTVINELCDGPWGSSKAGERKSNQAATEPLIESMRRKSAVTFFQFRPWLNYSIVMSPARAFGCVSATRDSSRALSRTGTTSRM